MDARPGTVPRLALALLAAGMLVPALAHLGAAEAVVDCATARAAGSAPVGCFALVPGSPYTGAGTGNTPLGADATLLASLLECAMRGDSASASCRQWEASRVPASVVCIE